MKPVYTFSELGRYGRLANQLWQLAGVVGNALRDQALVELPQWDYAPYFNVPHTFFEHKPGREIVDFYPDYMQDLKHFVGFEDTVRRMFQPSEGILFEIEDLDLEHRTAVGVRRGDYVNLPNHHPVVPLDYFEQALDMIGPTELLVCSDDIDWCKQQSIFKDAMFGRGRQAAPGEPSPTPYADRESAIGLHMMARCSNFVIANSTYHWWGAWLANKGTVIYPGEQWFGPAYAHVDTSVMFPEQWISVRY